MEKRKKKRKEDGEGFFVGVAKMLNEKKGNRKV
jgi:hypothetical protein